MDLSEGTVDVEPTPSNSTETGSQLDTATVAQEPSEPVIEKKIQTLLTSLGSGNVSIPDLSEEQIKLANTTAEELPLDQLFAPLPLSARFMKGLSNVKGLV